MVFVKNDILRAKGTLKSIDSFQSLNIDGERVRITTITLENVDALLNSEHLSTLQFHNLQLDFHEAILSDSLGHKMDYRACYYLKDDSQVLRCQVLQDLDLNRTYHYRAS